MVVGRWWELSYEEGEKGRLVANMVAMTNGVITLLVGVIVQVKLDQLYSLFEKKSWCYIPTWIAYFSNPMIIKLIFLKQK